MIGISFVRVLKAAWNNFWRNIWLSLATIVIMTITLLMLSFLYFANILGGELLRNIERKVDLSVTFKDGAAEEEIATLAEAMELRNDVESVRVISSEEALELFRRYHTNDPIVEESLRIVGDNPLPANMFIVATDPIYYEAIASHLQSPAYRELIAKVNLEQSREVIERLIGITQTVEQASLVITITFSLLVMLMMFSTVRLAIYSFREEIDIMRLVGASPWFIQGPFLAQALAVALLAVVVSTIIIYSVSNAFSDTLQQYFFSQPEDQFDIHAYAVSHWFQIVGLQILFASTLAIISTLMGIRRYLKR